MASWSSKRVNWVSRDRRAEDNYSNHPEWSCTVLVTALDWANRVDWETWAGDGAIGGGRCCDYRDRAWVPEVCKLPRKQSL
jgi:hypothetical protein